MIVDKIEEQNARFQVQSQSLSKQRAMIANIMGALDLELPVGSTSVDSTPEPKLSQKKVSVDMSHMYLQPLGKEDKKRPSQKCVEALRPERPPVSGCDQSPIPKQSGSSRMCLDSYGEAYFDLEEGLWLKPSPPGTKVYFDEDRGEWLKSEQAGPWFTVPGTICSPLMLRLKRTFGLRKMLSE